jgi:microcystin-dependent protein
MKKLEFVGILSAFSVLGIVSVLTPARATGDALPVGTIIAWGGEITSIPKDWMLCNGRVMSKSGNPDLFAAIGTSWGSSGADRFNLPDLRGRFLRGLDAGAGRDPDAKKRLPSKPGGSATGVGSVQEDSVQNHTHDQDEHTHGYLHQGNVYLANLTGMGYFPLRDLADTRSTDSSKAILKGAIKYNTKSKLNAGEETRPKNAAVNFIIKVK